MRRKLKHKVLPGAPELSQSLALPDSLPNLNPIEARLVTLLAFVQFVNILDFMMVMPLGPDFSADLNIPTAELGIVGGSYTAAAAVVGFISAFFLDRFDRKKALIFTVAGLGLATIAGALSNGLTSLLVARIVAGAFGGPASALALAIVADAIPIRKRGRALGVVMGAFSVAAIAGVPIGLELAHQGTWRTPFLVVGGLAIFAVAAIYKFLQLDSKNTQSEIEPSNHGRPATKKLQQFFQQIIHRDTLLALAVGACVMFSGFIVIPNIAAFVQKNMGLPREELGMLYFYGGIASLASMQIAGRLTDRIGAVKTVWAGTIFVLLALINGFMRQDPGFSALVIGVLFMMGTSIRAISFNTLISRIPAPHQRGAFMSLQSTIQHLASASGAFASSQLLMSDSDGKLIGMPGVAAISAVVSLAVPILAQIITRRLAKRDAN